MRIPIIGANIGLGTGIVLGAAAILVAPVVLPVVTGIVKSLAKAGIKGGLILYEKSKLAVEEAKETLEDLTAEARAEMAGEQEAEEGAAGRKKASLPMIKEGAKA